ncbi:hypothetical protein U27_01297 [Candidatus Vecturithrix granuli]|uniref:Uncharacterized protein n=1 Tax=Vecturithrix granuli TaxID=1499967 RepID=A0A081C9Z2_VECG1|nr:hypothetical protein U27_01297 [Candidatus Vecturithrix granuli]
MKPKYNERFNQPEGTDDRPEVQQLFNRLKVHVPELTRLLEQCCGHWGYEDPIYRFYHQSFKVYALQTQTMQIVAALQALRPEFPLNAWFMQIVTEGTGKTFVNEDNQRWPTVTRPIIEAFFHARYFLEMAVKYGTHLRCSPAQMPSGWAAFLELYNLR